MNEEYSFKDFTTEDVSGVPLTGIVKGSCFSTETLDAERFHPDSTCTFVDCNLDNCLIPVGCTVQGGTNKRFKVQEDLEDWFVNAGNKPIEPVNKRRFEQLGIPTSPSQITKATKEPITTEVLDAEIQGLGVV